MIDMIKGDHHGLFQETQDKKSFFRTFFCLCAAPPRANATQVIAYSEREMVERSALIVWGRVLSQITHKIGPRQYIVTDSTLAIRRIFKGDLLTTTLTVRCLGGRIGTQTAYVAGTGQLTVGEDVLLYLEAARPLPWRSHPTHYYLTGMAYGLWKMQWSPSHRQYQLSQQHDLPTRLARNARGQWAPLPHPHPQMRLLSDQLRTIQRYIHPQTTIHRTRSPRLHPSSRILQERQKTSPLHTPRLPKPTSPTPHAPIHPTKEREKR